MSNVVRHLNISSGRCVDTSLPSPCHTELARARTKTGRLGECVSGTAESCLSHTRHLTGRETGRLREGGEEVYSTSASSLQCPERTDDGATPPHGAWQWVWLSSRDPSRVERWTD